MKILLVEDEKQIADFIVDVLTKEGHSTTVSDSIDAVLKNKWASHHDVIVLDLMLAEGKRGEELVRALRKNKTTIPILVLSALGQISSKVELINMGADDYMTKPFDVQEFLARLNALYRRHLEKQSNALATYGDIRFHWKQGKVIRAGHEIQLTKKESDLLQFLLERKGEVVSFENILMRVWRAKVGYHSNVVQAVVRRLRKKLDTGFKHELIHNAHGVGYILKIE
ncbi:response regulator transcription factor [Candidatus Peregrinibacteria bacterium]|nr:MAG: response regulator transcription factor [Candidatus Peregrinibacteria bacterium]